MGPGGPRVLVHAPNHVGDVVMALPALARIVERRPGARIDCVARPHVAPLLVMAGLPIRTLEVERTRAWAAAWSLRGERYEEAILLSPSFRAAAFAFLTGARVRRGTPTDSRRWLLTVTTPQKERPGEHRVSFYLRIADPDWTGGTLDKRRREREASASAEGGAGGEPPAPRLEVGEAPRRELRELLGSDATEPVVGLFPGSNAPSRRWPEGRYAELARRLARERGVPIWVFGDRRESPLTARVAAAAGAHGVDLGGRTTLPVLAAAFARCGVLVTNDTGPMHLAAAVGTPIVALFGSSDPRRTGPLGVPARVLWRPDLPCVPCLKNRCPRSGRGTFLPEAVNECLHLLEIERVLEAVEALWARRN